MNARGVALCVNNLSSSDARIGVVWGRRRSGAPAQPTAAAARDLMLEALFGSGRHFLLADREAYAISSGTAAVVFSGEMRDYAHTNHRIDPVIGSCTASSRRDHLRALRVPARQPRPDADRQRGAAVTCSARPTATREASAPTRPPPRTRTPPPPAPGCS
jgi:hypothetical protein